MKRVKSTILLGAVLALCTIFSSCLDDNDPIAIYPTLGTISSTDPIKMESDFYGTILPKNPSLITTQQADSVGQRVLTNLYFDSEPTSTEGGEQSASMLDCYKVLTKPANDLRLPDAPSADSFGLAPIQPTSASLSKEHLNIQFNIQGGNENIPHRISLLLTDQTELDSDGYLSVYLRHHPNGDIQNTIYWGIVSFPLTSIPEYSDPTCKGIKVYYNSGADLNASITVKKHASKSDELTFSRMMEASQEIAHQHTLLTSQLQ